MSYEIIKDLIDIVSVFEAQNKGKKYTNDADGFLQWACSFSDGHHRADQAGEPEWEGKEKGTGAESVVSTLIVHLNRYARTYARSAIFGSPFSTQDEFIYLITLQAYGALTKMELIRRNVQDKPAGMLIINRLVQQGWVKQVDSATDKRSQVLKITKKGSTALGQIKEKIDLATRIVCGQLDRSERMELIRLLKKLEEFHHPIFMKSIDREVLLDQVSELLPAD